MSEEQQQSTSFDSDSFSRAETIELLQGTAQRFEELVTKLKTEAIEYQLPKSSYTSLLNTSEKIFNSIKEASDSPEKITAPIDFNKDFAESKLPQPETIEMLQGAADFYQTMVGKITAESLEYQLSMSNFENLVATTEKIANSIEKAPSNKIKTSSKTEFDREYSDNLFREESVTNNKINWPWLGLVAAILVIVISVAALSGNTQNVSEEVAIEIPAAQLEFTPEQKAIAAIDKQIEQIITTYEIDSLAKIEPNFVGDTITLEIADSWQELEPKKREETANKWLQDSRQLAFKKLAIIDKEGTSIARSPVIGKNIVILQQ